MIKMSVEIQQNGCVFHQTRWKTLELSWMFRVEIA